MLDPDDLRDNADTVALAGDDLGGILIGLALWLFIVIAAPLLVLILAAGLFSIELPIVIVLGILLAVARFAGLIPWSVVILDPATGDERRESYRSIWRATARIRGINENRKVQVRWAWA